MDMRVNQSFITKLFPALFTQFLFSTVSMPNQVFDPSDYSGNDVRNQLVDMP